MELGRAEKWPGAEPGLVYSSISRKRLRVLDLFCGPGGAGRGYADAGFEVVGVDRVEQPYYPFELVVGDALEFARNRGGEFDLIHASPPCQGYSRTRAMHRDVSYPDLVPETRRVLSESGVPWVIENVPGAPLNASLLLCGSMFGLRVQRHRLFEASWALPLAPRGCDHRGEWLNCYTSGSARKGTDRQYADAVGVTWAPARKGRGTGALEAIPPCYAEFVGRAFVLG